MTRSLSVTLKITEQHLIVTVRNGKSEAAINNNKRLCLRYTPTVLLKLTTERHEASRGFSATAELLVSVSSRSHTNKSGLSKKQSNKVATLFGPPCMSAGIWHSVL